MVIETDIGEESPSTGFDALLGVEYVEVTPERVVLRMPVEDRLLQPYGLVHGGVYAALAESAASVGASVALSGEGGAVGLSNHTDFLHAVRGGDLTATATPLDVGRSTQLWLVDIVDEEGRLAASSRVRLYNLRRR